MTAYQAVYPVAHLPTRQVTQRHVIMGFNCFRTHETLEILEFCFENNIILCRLPSHTSHKTQPCDVAVFASLKTAYRDQVDRLERGGVNTIGKQHFTALFSPAREKAFTPKNIKAGFAASGLFPLNPERVLRDMTKPPTDIVISRVEEVDVGSRPQDIVPQTQKFVKAGQTLLVGAALKDDQIQFLTTINDEAKVRRTTKPLVLGKAKVMSYEDLEEARVKRAEKDAAKEAKGKAKRSRKRRSATPEADTATPVKTKRGRKRKSDLPEADAPEPSIKVARMNEALLPESARASVVQTTRTPAVEDDIVPKPSRAPVAHMY